MSNKISIGEKNYKYFINYLYNGNKVKPLNIMLDDDDDDDDELLLWYG